MPFNSNFVFQVNPEPVYRNLGRWLHSIDTSWIWI